MKGDKSIVGTYQYDAWGKILNLNSLTAIAKVNPFRYRGYYYDTESNLYYLNSRYYNPEWGRFINADGLVSTGQDILGFNMFTYCGNNPIIFSDPSGTMRELFNLLNKLMPITIVLNKVAKKPDNLGSALGLMTDFVGGTVDVSLEIAKYLLKSSDRPNNKGVGAYKKYVSAQIATITKAQSYLSSAFNVLSYIFIAVDIGESAYFEYKMGYSPGKILWDSAVDLGYSLVGVCFSTQVGILASGVVASLLAVSNPIVLAAAVAVGGIAGGIIFDKVTDNRKRQFKGLVN